MTKDYYQRSMKALQLAGMSERTQECYTRSIRKLVDYLGKTPDHISEQELEDYFLHRRNVEQWLWPICVLPTAGLVLLYQCPQAGLAYLFLPGGKMRKKAPLLS